MTQADALVESCDGLPGRSDRLAGKNIRAFCNWRTCSCCRVDPQLLRQRAPTPAELQNPFAREIEDAKKAAAEEPARPRSFEALRNDFMREHGALISQSLHKVFDGPFRLQPAPLAQKVKQQFVEGCQSVGGAAELLPATHGSKEENYSGIFQK